MAQTLTSQAVQVEGKPVSQATVLVEPERLEVMLLVGSSSRGRGLWLGARLRGLLLVCSTPAVICLGQ